MEIPKVLLEKSQEVKSKLQSRYPGLAELFVPCFLNTIETTVSRLADGSYFVITGDIPAMWLRDSAAQLTPYLRFANEDNDLRAVLKSVIARQAFYVCLDPYANAFNAAANPDSHNDETDFHHELIWERKYEVDSLCAPLYLAHEYYTRTLDVSIFTKEFKKMIETIVEVFKREQNHPSASSYFFNRFDCAPSDTLPNGGKGNDVAYTGLTWSGFRPSDDRCVYGYLIPTNMMAVCALKKAAEMVDVGYGDTKLESECRSLAFDIDEGIKEHGVIDHEKYGKIYAYEVNGKGSVILMDDANSPSLLSAPYLGYTKKENELYRNTRRFLLSGDNPWYFDGTAAKGIGSPHTGAGKIWPISLIMQALTSESESEIESCLSMLSATHAGTGLMHESFDRNDPNDYSRPWFAWANSLFSELLIELTEH